MRKGVCFLDFLLKINSEGSLGLTPFHYTFAECLGGDHFTVVKVEGEIAYVRINFDQPSEGPLIPLNLSSPKGRRGVSFSRYYIDEVIKLDRASRLGFLLKHI